jgi:putative membrane protein
MKVVKVVVFMLLGVLLVAFLFQNYNAFLSTTTLEFRLPALTPFRSMPIPLYGLMLGSIFGGGLLVALYIGLGNFRLRRKIRALRRENNGLQTELQSLRNLPITESDVPVSQTPETVGSESVEEAEAANSR